MIRVAACRQARPSRWSFHVGYVGGFWGAGAIVIRFGKKGCWAICIGPRARVMRHGFHRTGGQPLDYVVVAAMEAYRLPWSSYWKVHGILYDRINRGVQTFDDQAADLRDEDQP